jgi:hypothetical protein
VSRSAVLHSGGDPREGIRFVGQARTGEAEIQTSVLDAGATEKLVGIAAAELPVK